MTTVLVVDDSALVRRFVTTVLNQAEGIDVVGTAANGEIALRKLDELNPDLVTLDIEMPVLDGLATVREIRRRRPRLPVIMFSTLSVSGASATLEALAAGASDYVTKPSNGVSLAASLEAVRDQLVPRVRALTADQGGPPPKRSAPSPVPPPARAAGAASRRPRLIAIGSSTGGPEALARVLGSFTTAPPVPIAIVQHMPPIFTAMLAQRLDRLGPVRVVEAQDGQRLDPGCAYIAPGGRHMELRRRAETVCVTLHDAPPENYSRPAVDVLFRSAAACYPGAVLAAVLTGMGQDGRAGSQALVARGSQVVAQDRASSVVWGMPRAVWEAGLAGIALPIAEIGPYLAAQCAATLPGTLR
jgi:two-component system chemotaxis response regulator CheB